MTFLSIDAPSRWENVRFRRLDRGWKNELATAGVRFLRTFRTEILAGIALAAMLQIAQGTGLL